MRAYLFRATSSALLRVAAHSDPGVASPPVPAETSSDPIAKWISWPSEVWTDPRIADAEGTERAPLDARRRYPNAVVFASAARHFKINALVDKLLMPRVVINTDPGGAMDIDDLAGELARRGDRPAVIVATVGTTMTETVDNLPAIVRVCDRLAITRRRIQVDAALSGLPLGLEPVNGVPCTEFGVRGVESMIISGRRVLSTLVPCRVLVYRSRRPAACAGQVCDTGTADATIPGSRSGRTTLLLWASLAGQGPAALREWVRVCRATAAHAVKALRRIGVGAQLVACGRPLPQTSGPHRATTALVPSG